MAEAAVEFLLNNLKDLLIYHSDLITDTKEQIQSLEKNLQIFSSFLSESLKNRSKNELDSNIRDVVYEVEDVIDAVVTEALEKKSTSSFFKFWKPSVNLHNVGEKVEVLVEKIRRARIHLTNLTLDDEDKYAKPEARPPRLKDVVGFADVTEVVIQRLIKETEYFDVVGLIGMFGLGKTTLAWKIFNDPAILYQFPVRIWLSISQDFSDKDIFLAILGNFTTITEDVRHKEDKEIAQMAAAYLESTSFLIVLDDVWTASDWDRLRNALPNNHNNKGKVLITSRTKDVGMYACNPRLPTQLRFLSEDESWELLRLEALGKLDCHHELMNIGQFIARECKGLPLAIVVIGGILATMYSESDLNATRKAWEKVSTQVNMYLNNDPAHRMNKFIFLSYDKLPYHLRACFLYLGMFPKDYEIPASKLILMWIGEGFIQQSKDSSLEETGEKYLEDLINRNMVVIDKTKADGKIKTCRIHDVWRNFCLTEAGNENENFLQEVRFIDGVFSPSVSDLKKYRRLCVHSSCLKFITLEPFGPCVRSFVCLPKQEVILPSENISYVPKAFKLLRVLDVKPIRFPKLSSDFFQLVHMRYITLSLDSSTLSSKFSQLWNLQTLIVDTTSKTLEVKADIWKLIQLRHFKTNASASLIKPSKDSKHGAELQTLGTISVESCKAEIFEQARNLKKLGIRGHLALLLEGKKGSFESVGRMKDLENLKLINDLHEGQLNGLPQPYQFPSRLKSLTLRATFLDWSNMSVLGLLANLEVLKVKDKAFMGKNWKAVDGGFRHLELLHIEETDLVVWTASSHHYPRLRGLVLRNCEGLDKIPTGLADVATFQMLELNTCKSAIASAREIHAVKRKADVAFKLSVFPPTN